MAQDKNDMFRMDEKNTTDTGSDLPHGDGTVSDEDTNKISDVKSKRQKKTGQDHSTENREDMTPSEGVGGVQSANDTTSDIAQIKS